jgi:hypothetical protein
LYVNPEQEKKQSCAKKNIILICVLTLCTSQNVKVVLEQVVDGGFLYRMCITLLIPSLICENHIIIIPLLIFVLANNPTFHIPNYHQHQDSGPSLTKRKG